MTPSSITTDSDILDLAAEDGMQSAYVPQDALWEGYPELRVEFLNKIPDDWTCGDGEAMNTTNILGWANKWSLKGEGKTPRFARGGASQIRVWFNGNRVALIHEHMVNLHDHAPIILGLL